MHLQLSRPVLVYVAVGTAALHCIVNAADTESPVTCSCRYLMCVNDDQVKLLLETLQMSVSSCMQHPELPTLRPQMVGRLMAAHHASRVAVRTLLTLQLHCFLHG